MTDTVDKDTRSYIMAQVKGKNTRPEVMFRKAIFARGFRYRLHRKDLPSKPDLVFPRINAVIFIHGCLWHWHGCTRSRMPETNADYWTKKIERNKSRDIEHQSLLLSLGWRVLVVWECSLKVRYLEAVVDLAADWLNDGSMTRCGSIQLEQSATKGKTRVQLADKMPKI